MLTPGTRWLYPKSPGVARPVTLGAVAIRRYGVQGTEGCAAEGADPVLSALADHTLPVYFVGTRSSGGRGT